MKMRDFASCGVVLTVCLMLNPVTHGMHRLVELQQVPVERLVTNLEAAVKKESSTHAKFIDRHFAVRNRHWTEHGSA
jgi:hypothetical protein